MTNDMSPLVFYSHDPQYTSVEESQWEIPALKSNWNVSVVHYFWE